MNIEREIEQKRRDGEGWLWEWLMTTPNRFSPHRSGSARQIPTRRNDPREVPGVRIVLGWTKFGP